MAKAPLAPDADPAAFLNRSQCAPSPVRNDRAGEARQRRAIWHATGKQHPEQIKCPHSIDLVSTLRRILSRPTSQLDPDKSDILRRVWLENGEGPIHRATAPVLADRRNNAFSIAPMGQKSAVGDRMEVLSGDDNPRRRDGHICADDRMDCRTDKSAEPFPVCAINGATQLGGILLSPWKCPFRGRYTACRSLGHTVQRWFGKCLSFRPRGFADLGQPTTQVNQESR